ncbi:MAG: cytochrome c family protein, partial [Myxococcales bacterium]|nr:cytochrome c family protein [Myxococcales bacterium]
MSPFWLWQALALALAGIAGWLATRALSRPLRALGIGGIVVLALWGFVFFAPAPIDAELMASLPVMEPLEGYGSSGACRSCHPAQYASWYGS